MIRSPIACCATSIPMCFRKWIFAATAVLAATAWAPVSAQFGDGGMGGGMMMGGSHQGRPVVVAPAPPDTVAAKAAFALLDEVVELGEVKVAIDDLDDFLQRELEEVGVFIDARALHVAGVGLSNEIEAVVPPMPLRSALRKLLSPLALKVAVEDDGFVITADFVELTRRGIATDLWLSGDGDAKQAILQRLGQSISISSGDEPLLELVARLSDQFKIPMAIDRRALEEIGLSSEEPVTIELKNVSLRSALRLMLRELDLTYMVQNEVLRITTIEAAEENLVKRAYFMEGLGIPHNDATSMIKLVQATIVPDTWEVLGGPSTIAPFLSSSGERPAIVVDTTSDVHDQIQVMLTSLRASRFGQDPGMIQPVQGGKQSKK